MGALVHNQKVTTQHLSDSESTCYAHAVATVIRAAQDRIVGRYVNDFDDLVCEITSEFGYEGADVVGVLETICPRKRLQSAVRDPSEVLSILEERPLVASFWLTQTQWDNFSRFFKENPRGKLSSAYLGPADPRDPRPGHAVAIIGIGQDRGAYYFKMKNSWGRNFADYGYFRVAFDAFGPEVEYVDVFYTFNDISEREHAAYESAQNHLMSLRS